MSTSRGDWDVDPPRDLRSYGSSSELSLATWAFEYDVIPALVPFEYRDFDPVNAVQNIREAIAESPPTKATFSVPELEEICAQTARYNRSYFRTLIRLAGAWAYDDGSYYLENRMVKRWVNPAYVHAKSMDPTITDPQARIEELRHAASLGIITLDDIGPRFGITEGGVYEFCTSRGIPWTEWRKWGLRRFSRTVKLVRDWTDYSEKSLGEAFGVPESTIGDWMRLFYAADFEPPADPSHESWFGPTYGGE